MIPGGLRDPAYPHGRNSFSEKELAGGIFLRIFSQGRGLSPDTARLSAGPRGADGEGCESRCLSPRAAMHLPTFTTPKVTELTLTGSAQALAVPSCKWFSLKARDATKTLTIAHASGGDEYTIAAGKSFDAPLGDYLPHTLYVKGTAADVAELITYQ
jgi:hypothetical protein